MSARLSRLSAYEVTIPLPRPLYLSSGPITARDYVIVEAADDDGRIGRSVGYTRGAPMAATIQRMLSARWEGSDLDTYAQTYEATARSSNFMGTHGIYWRAISLADCAVYDLLAQRAGQPLHAYLGGTYRSVETTLAGCYPVADETPESLALLMQEMDRYGAAGIKITASSDPARDTERLRLCRAALPDGAPFIIDLYGMAPEAPVLLPFARQWSEYHMAWLEDPYGFDDFSNLSALADQLEYPVGVGDEQSGLHHFENLIRYGHIRFVRLDATTCGGVTGFMRIAHRVTELGLPISCHVFHHLHSQLACAVPGVRFVEYMLPQTGVDAIQYLLPEDLDWDAGKLVPTTRPGVGFIWDEAVLRSHQRLIS